jgi:hypothetical protein
MKVQQTYLRKGTRTESTLIVSGVENGPLAIGEVAWSMHAARAAGELITTCAWCRSVKLDGAWLRPPESALLAIQERLALTFGICPGCLVSHKARRSSERAGSARSA